MFLEQITTETPEAAAALFEMRDAKAGQEKYHCSAGWLAAFPNAALDIGQDRFDWITARLGVFDEMAARRGCLADWIGVRYAPAWIAFRRDWSGGGTRMLLSASTTAWMQTVTSYKADHIMWRMAEKAPAGRITYLDPTEDKRRASRACGWLVSWLFAGMTDEEIHVLYEVNSWQIVQRTRTAFARTIGLKLASQRGRWGGARYTLKESRKNSLSVYLERSRVSILILRERKRRKEGKRD